MTPLQACKWLESSWIGTVIRGSKWGFALVEMVHLLALALLGGALVVSALHSFGLIFRGSPPGAISRELARVQLASLAMMIASGLLLFSDGPLRYYGNAAFRVKLVLMVGAILTGVLSYLTGAKTATLLALCLWLGVGIAGRVIGVL